VHQIVVGLVPLEAKWRWNFRIGVIIEILINIRRLIVISNSPTQNPSCTKELHSKENYFFKTLLLFAMFFQTRRILQEKMMVLILKNT
jgi:hypothetical protein